jgi:hypothetical protein
VQFPFPTPTPLLFPIGPFNHDVLRGGGERGMYGIRKVDVWKLLGGEKDCMNFDNLDMAEAMLRRNTMAETSCVGLSRKDGKANSWFKCENSIVLVWISCDLIRYLLII